MATIAYSIDRDRGEARFFLIMAWIMAAVIVAGFSFNLAMGRSNFGMPPLVHVHALVMMSFVGLYVVQNALVSSNNLALHRRLGWLSAAYAPAIVGMGLLMTRWSVQQRGGPFFFDQNQFLISNILQIVTTGVLLAWGVTARRNTGWHRRLLYCGFATLTGPAIGRLAPSPLFIPYAWYIGAILSPLLFAAIGIIADRRRYGRAHPAWFCALGIVFAVQIVADLIAYSDAGVAFTRQFVAGTPGAERPMQAFLPS